MNKNNNNLSPLPKYHKENMYYCLILFNNEAFVGSTRSTTCTQHFTSSSNQNHLSTHYVSTSSSFSSNLSNLSSNSQRTMTTRRDSIWDDSFSFDNLPLDVNELKICLFLLGKPTKFFSTSFVKNVLGGVDATVDTLINNNSSNANSTNASVSSSSSSNSGHGGVGASLNGSTSNNVSINNSNSNNGSSKMLDPLLIGYVNVKLDDLMNKGLCEQWYTLQPSVNVATSSSSSSSSTYLNQNSFFSTNGKLFY